MATWLNIKVVKKIYNTHIYTTSEIKRIAKVASRLVPTMVGLYLLAALIVLAKNFTEIPGVFNLIIMDAFSGKAVAGGALGSVIIIGVKRGLFSNEAGTGTETMAHGAAKTNEPVREGLVAMLGPFIDTIIVCSITALIILISGVYTQDLNGVSMTAMAFKTVVSLSHAPEHLAAFVLGLTDNPYFFYCTG